MSNRVTTPVRVVIVALCLVGVLAAVGRTVIAVLQQPRDARELATIAFATVFLSFGVPGIPRGAFVMLTPLFAVLGLPIEGIGILIAVAHSRTCLRQR